MKKTLEPLEEIHESIKELRQSMVWFKWLLIVTIGGLVLFVLTASIGVLPSI